MMAYLKGNDAFGGGGAGAFGANVSSLRRAIAWYKRAVTLDSVFAVAWARLAQARVALFSTLGVCRTRRIFPRHGLLPSARLAFATSLKDTSRLGTTTAMGGNSGVARWPSIRLHTEGSEQCRCPNESRTGRARPRQVELRTGSPQGRGRTLGTRARKGM